MFHVFFFGVYIYLLPGRQPTTMSSSSCDDDDFFYVFFLVSWQLPLLGFIFSEVKLKHF